MSILVFPVTGSIGDSVIVANTSIGSSFVDTSRDDPFTGVSINPLVWSVGTTGLVNTVTGSGLQVELRKNIGGSSCALTSLSTYVDGNISIDYNINSAFMADQPTSTITYAELEMVFGISTTFSISRVLIPGTNGHQVLVTLLVDGVLQSSAVLLTTSASGRLRLVKSDNILVAMHDQIILTKINFPSLTNFNVQISADTGGQDEYINVGFQQYQSSPGVLFGDTFMDAVDLVTADRINGIIPSSSQVGSTTVVVFNHDGALGSLSAAFEYPLVLGASLSPNMGINGNIQTDLTLG